MTSTKRSNAATLYPSSLYDDDIEAALKTNLLTENEKDITCAGAEYDSDDDEDDVSISIQCHVLVSMLQYSAHDLLSLVQLFTSEQAYVTRNEDQQLLLLCYPTTVGSHYMGFANSEYVGESDVMDSTKLYLYLPVSLQSCQFA
jgi:hypothetical protein